MAFQWGQGGKRLTPEQIAQRQRVASGLMQSDYSPIVSPWQGLARVAGNLTGALEQNGLDRASAANAAETQQVLASLGPSADGKPNIAALLAGAGNPYVDEGVRGLAASQYGAATKPAPINDTEADFAFRQKMLGEQAAKDWLARGNDPMITTTLPGGDFYAGPQSGLAQRLASGGVPPQAPPSPPRPPIGAIVADPFGDGGPAAQAPATFPGSVQGTGRGY